MGVAITAPRFQDPAQDRFAKQLVSAIRSLDKRAGGGSATLQQVIVGGTSAPSVPDGEAVTPTQPEGFSATGSYSAILLQWTMPSYQGHAVTEIYRSTEDNFGSAIQIAEVSMRLYSDAPGPGQVFYYWIRHRNILLEQGPLNDTAGTRAETAQDLDSLFSLLTGKITTTYLDTHLADTFGLIENIDQWQQQVDSTLEGLDERAGNVQTQADNLLGRLDFTQLQYALQQQDTERGFYQLFEGLYDNLASAESAFSEEGQVIGYARAIENVVQHPETGLPATRAALISESETRADETEALARNYNGLSAQVNHPDTGLPETLARLGREEVARSDGDSAQASALETFGAKIFAEDGTTLQAAFVTNLDEAFTGDGVALSSKFTNLNAQVNHPITGLPRTRADLSDESRARSDADNAMSQRITTLSANVFNEEGTALAAGFVSQIDTAYASDGVGLSQRITDLGSSVGDINTDLENNYYTKTGADDAITTAITSHQITVDIDGQPTTATLAEYAELAYSADTNFTAQWGVVTDVDGLQGGVGFYNDGQRTLFAMNAQYIATVDPLTNEVSDLFNIVQNDPDIPDGVYINTAFIKAATIQELVAGTVTADEVVAAIRIDTPTIEGGVITGATQTLQVGSETWQVDPGSTMPIWFGPTHLLSSKSTSNATFGCSSNGRVYARDLTVRDASGNVMMDTNGLSQTYIKNLTIDTLDIAGDAVTVPLAVESPVFNGITTTPIDVTYNQGQGGTVLFSFAVSVLRIGDVSGAYDTVDLHVDVFAGTQLIKTISHYEVDADGTEGNDGRKLWPVTGSVSINTASVRVRLRVVSNTSGQSMRTQASGFITSAKR